MTLLFLKNIGRLLLSLMHKKTAFEAKFHGINGEKKELHTEEMYMKILDAMRNDEFIVSRSKRERTFT